MSTIYATRLGFSYQDKYACFLFLDALREGTIREFYTDYPFGKQLSLDILIKTGIDDEITEERAYEVKTGKSFKNDTKYKKRQSSEIKDVVIGFLEYSKLSPEVKGFISYSKGVQLQLLTYRNPADNLFNSQRLTDSAKISAQELIAKLSMSNMRSMTSVHSFFKRVRFEEIPYTNDQTWTRLDEHIIAHIREIASALGANIRVYELPDEYLASKLMFLIQKNAGTGQDVTKELLSEIINFMILRRILGDYSNGATSPVQAKSMANTYIRSELASTFKLGPVLPLDGPAESMNASTVDVFDTATTGVING